MSYRDDMEFVMNNIYFDLDYSNTIKTKEKFNYLVNNLNMDYLISDKSRDNMYLSMNAKTKTSKIICGSYSLKID